MATTVTEIDEAEDTRDSRRMDPELRIMGQMLRLLDDLEEPAKARVVRWLESRYTRSVLDPRD